MPFKKIEQPDDWGNNDFCTSPEHNPPGNIVLEPGTYEYTCPACGKTSRIIIPLITCKVNNG